MLARGTLVCALLLGSFAVRAQETPAPKPVTVRAVAELMQAAQRSAPATVLSEQDSLIAAQISARIERWHVRVGDSVAAGAPLLQLECDDYQHALSAAEARLKLARQQLERARDLSRSRNLSAETLDQRQAEQAAQQAARDSAALNTRRCQVSAPFAGVIAERLADSGETVAAGTPLLRLVDTTQVELSAQMAAEDAADAARASLWRFAAQGQSWTLRLRSLLPVVDAKARQQEARLVFETTPPPAPGVSGRLLWQGTQRQLPPQFLQTRGGVPGVFLAEQGQARFHPVPGAVEGRPLPVDLPAEAQVVVQGREGLNEGDSLKILP